MKINLNDGKSSPSKDLMTWILLRELSLDCSNDDHAHISRTRAAKKLIKMCIN